MTQSITILGATGSIGRSTLDVVSRYPERFSVHAVAGGSRVEPLVDVCLSARPKRAVIADASKVVELEQALCTVGLGDIEVLGGPEAVSRLADDPDTDVVVQAVVGAAGVAPTFAAARAGKRLLLANKERRPSSDGDRQEFRLRASARRQRAQCDLPVPRGRD